MRSHSRLHLLLVSWLLLLVGVPTAHPHQEPTGREDLTANKGPQLSDLLTGSGFQIKFGDRYDFRASRNKGHFAFLFKDFSLFEHGEAISPGDFGIADDPIKFGDAPFTFKLSEGLTEIGGTLLSGIGVQPISLGGMLPTNLRLLVGYDAQVEKDKQSTGFAGLEWVPFGPYAKDKETFLGLGVRYERRNTKADDTESTGTISLRGRLGIGFGFVLSAQRLARIVDDANKIASVTPQELVPFLKKLSQKRGVPYGAMITVGIDDVLADIIEDLNKEIAAQRATSPGADVAGLLARRGEVEKERQALLAVPPPVRQPGESDEALRTRGLEAARKAAIDFLENRVPTMDQENRDAILAGLKEEIIGTLAARAETLRSNIEPERSGNPEVRTLEDQLKESAPNNPRLSLFTEFDGSFGFGEKHDGPRSRGILSLNLRYQFRPNDEDSPYVWVRFEYGRTRAEPDKGVGSLLVTGVYRF